MCVCVCMRVRVHGCLCVCVTFELYKASVITIETQINRKPNESVADHDPTMTVEFIIVN